MTCTRCGAALAAGPDAGCPRCLFSLEIPAAVLGGCLELGEEIGRGGMGAVYRARHQRLDRTVAVKILPEELAAEPEFVARFEREARALAMLSHPNIVTVHDCGRDGDASYIVMELVDGRPLSELLPLPPDRAVDLCAQVLDALACAHQQGVVHRDIKPENILVTESGRVKVTDFGIARIVRADGRGQTVTSDNVVVGTPQYLAPEAMAGAPPDPRMDLYSVGVVLYQTVTGALPVGTFPPLPGRLDAVVRRALENDPARRYASAGEMRQALLATGPSTAAGPAELPVDELTWVRVVAVLQSISTIVALLAFVMSVTPRIVMPGDAPVLVSFVRKKLADGREVSYARAEVWWTLATLATFAVAITAYGFLRRHWRREGLEVRDPGGPVPQSKSVLVVGLLALAVYGVRLSLEAAGILAVSPYIQVAGVLIETAMLYFAWVTILLAWRRHRPLAREVRLWLGMALALIPPAIQLVHDVRTWTPP